MEYFKHNLSDVLSINIGKGTKIWQFVVILKDAIIGENCNINANVFIENDVRLGNNVTIKSGVQIWDGISIEDNVFIGPNVTFTNDIIPRSKQYPESFEVTKINQGASIGANSTILAGNTVGRYAMIGAGSVLTKNVGDYELWYGNPAKHMGYITKKGIVLDKNLFSKSQNKRYQWLKGELKQNQ